MRRGSTQNRHGVSERPAGGCDRKATLESRRRVDPDRGTNGLRYEKHDLAAAYYRSAINAAQLAGNDALTSVALTRMSFLPTYDKKPWEAIPYQEEAQRLAASSATPTTRAWIAAVTAEAH